MPRLDSTPPSQPDIIADFAADKRLAVLADPAWYGEWRLRFVLWTLENRGYAFHLVHDDLPAIGRHTTYDGLERLPEKVGSALIICDPAVAPDLVKLAYQNGCKRVWLNSGSSSAEAEVKAGEYGLDALHDLSLLSYLDPIVGVYALLRWWDQRRRTARQEAEEDPDTGEAGDVEQEEAGQEQTEPEEADEEDQAEGSKSGEQDDS